MISIPDKLAECSGNFQHMAFRLDEAEDSLQAAVAEAHDHGYSVDQISRLTGLVTESVSAMIDKEREYREVAIRGLPEGFPDFS